jgi:hypothetical protein
MTTTTLKTLQRAFLASLLLVTAAACSILPPSPQVANADIASQNAVVQGD